MNSQQPVEVAIAILYQEGHFLLQLRDNIPGILYPGCWGLFGGHLEPGETPEQTLRRELIEEINYNVSTISLFASYEQEKIIRHVYYAPLMVSIDHLVLQEGWDFGLLPPETIRQGSSYSTKAGQFRPLGKPHQRILLDFLETKEFLISGQS
jgi:8-oxo-dGTP pyrophosphatase MutT (NUDIX family)